MARQIEFVNDHPTDPWILSFLGGREVPAASSLDLTNEVSDNRLIAAIQNAITPLVFDAQHYLRINGTNWSPSESEGYGNQSDLGATPGLAHDLGGVAHDPDTLSNLNSKITDADLDDRGDPRDPNPHASTHEGGGDPIDVAGIGGDAAGTPRPPQAHDFAGAAHNADTLGNLNSKITDATLDDSGDPRDPNAHDLAGAAHNADTKASLDAKVSDASLLSTRPSEISGLPAKASPTVSDLVVIEDVADSSNKKQALLGDLPSAGPLSKIFQGYDNTGGMTVTNVAQPISLDVEGIKDDYFTHSTTVNPAEVTVLHTGLYRISARANIGAVDSTGGIRGNPLLEVEIDSGGGFTSISELSGGYIREDSDRLSTMLVIGPTYLSLSSGDKIRMVVYDTVGNEPNESTQAGGSALSVEFVDRSGTGGVVVNNLKDVGDVDAPAPPDRGILRFNSSTTKWEEYQDIIPELVPHQVSANYTPTWSTLAANGPVIIVDSSGGDVQVTLPAADTIPNDGLLHRAWVHHLTGGNRCSVVVSGENFYDGLATLVIPESETAQLGGMYMGVGNPGWLRISHIDTRLQVRRAATWASGNFSAVAAIPWDTQDIEDNVDVLEWSAATPTRATAKVAGKYFVGFLINIDSTGGSTYIVQAALRLNGSTIVNGTVLRTGNYQNEDQSASLPAVMIDLNANDYIEVVMQHASLTGNLESASLMIHTEV